MSLDKSPVLAILEAVSFEARLALIHTRPHMSLTAFELVEIDLALLCGRRYLSIGTSPTDDIALSTPTQNDRACGVTLAFDLAACVFLVSAHDGEQLIKFTEYGGEHSVSAFVPTGSASFAFGADKRYVFTIHVHSIRTLERLSVDRWLELYASSIGEKLDSRPYVQVDTATPLGLDYTIFDPIGGGGLGTVWSGLQHGTGRLVAIKTARSEPETDLDREDLLWEASLMSFNNHVRPWAPVQISPWLTHRL